MTQKEEPKDNSMILLFKVVAGLIGLCIGLSMIF